jgi:hypothetical protein
MFVKKLHGDAVETELLEVALKSPSAPYGFFAALFCKEDKKWFKIQFPATRVMVRTVVPIYLAVQELTKFSDVKSGLTNFDTATKYLMFSLYYHLCGVQSF